MSRDGRVARREWVWVASVSGVILLVSTVPYVLGYLAQTPAMRFGGALLDREDYESYLARMWQGYRGEWKAVLLFTPEDHVGVCFVPLYVVLGHIARVLSLSLPSVYQLARLIFGGWMLRVIYCFIAHIVDAVRTRRTAFLLAVAASGLGWLTQMIAPAPSGGVSPMDFWLLDGFVYLALLVSPHFCLSIALVLSVFTQCLRFTAEPSWRAGVLMTVASFSLGFIHPYMLLIADLVPAIYWVIEWLKTRRLTLACLSVLFSMVVVQLPLVIYELSVFRTNPVYAGWSQQNITLSPPLGVYLLGYGALGILGAIGVLTRARRGSQEAQKLVFPLVWIGLVAVLVYLPWNFQRRFVEGVQVPLGLVAGVGLAEGLLPVGQAQIQSHRRELLRIGAIALLAMSNLYLTSGLALAAATQSPLLFLDGAMLAGIDWLGENTRWDRTVLAGPGTGNLIPGRIGHRVVVGHWMETVDYAGKLESVKRFYASETSDEERVALLKAWDADFVFVGPEERCMGGLSPVAADYLEPVFGNEACSVYRVVWEDYE